MKEVFEYTIISAITATLFFGGIKLFDFYIDKPLSIFLYLVINSLLISLIDKDSKIKDLEDSEDY